MQKLVEDLVGKIKNSLTSPDALEAYVKILEPNVLNARNNFITSLTRTFSSLGNNVEVELLNFYEYSTKSATPIYSFDLERKPGVVDKVYVMNLLFIHQTRPQKTLYVLPFVTLKNEPNKIYLAMIYVDPNNVAVVYPRPIVP